MSNRLLWKGRLYYLLVVDSVDHTVLSGYTYDHCKDHDWHHSFYLDHQDYTRFEEESATLVWECEDRLYSYNDEKFIEGKMLVDLLKQVSIVEEGYGIMRQQVNEILGKTNYYNDCHGLQAKEAAENIMIHYFESEGLSTEGWEVREIPLADDTGNYPVAVVLCVNNKTLRREITMNITPEGNLYNCSPDELEQIILPTIKEAIWHPRAKY